MVKAWREIVTIPTYKVGHAEKNPIFLEKRVYQGSSGVVYPYPVIESIADEKEDVEYHAVWIENEYIKVMILPELGGRVQMAYDKIKKRHFVYYNHVIKPALVGLTGPWISGGIEFNWPQHHRPSTYLPVDSTIEQNEDGSVTVWVNEQEKMFHQKGAAGFTLRPGCAYLEIKGMVYNRTDTPQTFLWWANPAVAVNDHYQSVFPPDINAVFDHGKRAVSSFPIATGTYYKMDYSSGVDISNYKNIKVPTSYMAVNSKYNFEGGYENDSKGGMLHVANHHLSPGKKQWTWGNGDFGQAWDRNLTDEDGPYIELMAGVYTENQPDFTWLMPYEEKHFTQYFMPYRELGIVKNASKNLIMNIVEVESGVELKLQATRKSTYHVVLKSRVGEVLFDETLELTPEEIFSKPINIKSVSWHDIYFVAYNIECGRNAIEMEWMPEPDTIKPIPDPAEAALLPKDIKTNEQLYLTGLHIEQYRHATYSPLDYYEEALCRDPDDYRCNNAMGLWFVRKGRFARAEEYLRKAQKVLYKRNPNPYDGEPLYNLGLALKYQGKLDEAYNWFWKSTWNKGWADVGYFAAAQISIGQHRIEDAIDDVERSLISNWHNHKARALKLSILRYAGRKYEDVKAFIDESLKLDLFNYGVLYEKYLLTKDETVLKQMTELMHGSINNYQELALDYAQAGLWSECIGVLDLAIKQGADDPMTYYYKGWAQLKQGNAVEANNTFEEAEKQDSAYCFPNRLEAILALEAAKASHKDGAFAPYYLGCLFYDKRQYDVAKTNWELSAKLNPKFPTVWRNLALYFANKADDHTTALAYMEKAFKLNTHDARILMELDQLYKRLQHSQKERLAFLEQYPELIEQRDDLLLEEITLLNQTGNYQKAMQLLDAHIFHPWEGGEGKVSGQYQLCRTELAKNALAAHDYDTAVQLLKECLEFPHHLGEGKLQGAQENDFYYFMGLGYEGLGDMVKARECWEHATEGPQEPAAALYYNDAKPDKIFYQGLALLKLGREGEARGRFYKLINYGKNHIFEKVVMDYFAVSLPDLLIWEDSLDLKNQIHCKYMLALGYYGLGDVEHGEKYLQDVESLDTNHLGIMQLRTLVTLGLNQL
ncbi:MAG: DUF5107 domain-containing protein [Prevotella sp.]|jgi:tetratricopeptide (TPR) repeat protein